MKQSLFYLVLCAFILLSCERNTYQDYMPERFEGHSSVRISPQEAVEQVKNFLSAWADETRGGVPQKEIGEVYAWRTSDIYPSKHGTRGTLSSLLPDTLLYIVNMENEEGYALVSADASKPDVVAFVEQGSLCPGQEIENPGFQLFLEGFTRYSEPPVPILDSITQKPFLKDSVKVKSHTIWKYDMRVLPLLTTQWSQRYPYNKYCVLSSGWLAPAGCAPVALGQIVAYHRYPSSYAGHEYDWDSILEYDKVPEYDLTACNSVAHLINDIGLSIGIQYTSDAGGVNDADIHRLWNKFDYHYHESNTCSFDSLKASLKRHEPVLIYGRGTYNGNYTGHCWVIDGIAVMSQYDLDTPVCSSVPPYPPYVKINSYKLVHCNWGWGGLDDGYFLYDALEKKFDASSHTTSDIEVVINDVRGVQWQIRPLINN